MAQQVIRDISVSNKDASICLLRAASQKSTMTHNAYSTAREAASSSSNSSKTSATGGYGDFSASVSDESSSSQSNSYANKDSGSWTKAFSAFIDEGFVQVIPGETKKFAVEGQIAYISVVVLEGKCFINNWATQETDFVFANSNLFAPKAKEEELPGGIKCGPIYAIKSISSGKYLDGRGGEKDPLMTQRNPKGDKYLNWKVIKTNIGYAIKSVSSGKFLDGRAGQSDPWMTNRDPTDDKYLNWIFRKTNGGTNNVAIKSISSGKFLDGRAGQSDPWMTNRDPTDDKYLQWVFVPM